MEKLTHTQAYKENLFSLCKGIRGKILIPSIQRDFIMGSNDEIVKNIYEEIYTKMVSNDIMKFSTLLAYKDEQDNLVIYDGQQRLTTLFVLLAQAWRQCTNCNYKISDYLGYSDNDRQDSLALLDKIASGEEYSKDIFDTSSYSIHNILKLINIENSQFATKFSDFIGNNIEFNIVYKNKVNDIEQYFIDLNDGLQLNHYQIFKAELTDHIIKNLGVNSTTEKWLYSIDNEYQYSWVKNESNTQECGSEYIVAFYCILASYYLDTDEHLKMISQLTLEHLDLAYKIADNVVNNKKYSTGNEYTTSYFELGYNYNSFIIDVAEKLYRDSKESDIIKTSSQQVFDFGLLSLFIIEDKLAIAIANSFIEEATSVEIYRRKDRISIFAANYSIANSNKENFKNFTTNKFKFYCDFMCYVIKYYLNYGKESILDGTMVKSLKDKNIKFEEVPYNLVNLINEQIYAYNNNESIVEADRLAKREYGNKYDVQSNFLYNNDFFYENKSCLIETLCKSDTKLLAQNMRVQITTSGASTSLLSKKCDVILPSLRAIYEYRHKAKYSKRLLHILAISNQIFSGRFDRNPLYRGVFEKEIFKLAIESNRDYEVFIIPSRNTEIIKLPINYNLETYIFSDDGTEGILTLGILSALMGTNKTICKSHKLKINNLIRDDSEGNLQVFQGKLTDKAIKLLNAVRK